MKILSKSKNLNMNKTEISLNIILIRYYVVFLVSLLTALGICRLMRFCRLLHHVKLGVCRFMRVMHSLGLLRSKIPCNSSMRLD